MGVFSELLAPILKPDLLRTVHKSKIQQFIWAIGLISIGLGVWTILQTPTLLLPSWFLAVLFVPITILCSLGLGFLIKKIFKSNWSVITFTAIIMSTLCLSYYISEYKPTYKIIIPTNFIGEVRLLLSNENTNDFNINKYGVGYINQKTFKNGFQPKIIKGGQDITSQIKAYSIGATATTTSTSSLSVDYLTFKVPGTTQNEITTDIDELVKVNGIDTTRLKIK